MPAFGLMRNAGKSPCEAPIRYPSSALNSSPMVNAKGEDQIAQTIKQIARDNNIPIVENRPVARELYTNLKVCDIIPQIYFNVIATIYSQLDKFKNK